MAGASFWFQKVFMSDTSKRFTKFGENVAYDTPSGVPTTSTIEENIEVVKRIVFFFLIGRKFTEQVLIISHECFIQTRHSKVCFQNFTILNQSNA